MDDDTLRSLREALELSPENKKLRGVLLQAYVSRDEPGEGADLLEDLAPEDLESVEHRRAAAAVHRALGNPRDALAFAEACGEDPESLLLRARAHLSLEERDAGRALYERAVAGNAALEDADLRAALSARVREAAAPAGGQTRLRVISNDDTRDQEVDRLLQPEPESVDFSDVGGLDDVKNQIRRRIITPFRKPTLFQKFKKRVGGGILLYGPPGCGKTLLARATAGECQAQFFNVAISDVLDMYIGESEQKLHSLFEKARASTPAVLFFDEIEALGGKRQYSRESTSSKLVSQFLAEMDGFARTNEGVLVLGATNVPWAVDSAFRRPGRFDRVLFVPPPDRAARAAILQILLAGRPTATDIDAAALASRTSGYSGADLSNLVETAVDVAIEASIEQEAEVPISQEHLTGALREVKSTTLEWLTTARNHARYANESGHYDEVLAFLDRHGRG